MKTLHLLAKAGIDWGLAGKKRGCSDVSCTFMHAQALKPAHGMQTMQAQYWIFLQQVEQAALTLA